MIKDYSLYTLENGRTVRVPNEAIELNMRMLKCSRQEAVDVWLFDNDYIDNEEEQALTAKAKENRVTATVHKAKSTEYKQKTQRERVVKEDKTKNGIIQAIETAISENADYCKVVKAGKMIVFKQGGEYFKLDLTRYTKKGLESLKTKGEFDTYFTEG